MARPPGPSRRAGLRRLEPLAVLAVALLALHPCDITRPLWYDELLSFYLASLPSPSALFDVLRVSANPPLYFLSAHHALAALGPTEAAVRLPALLATLAAALSVWYFVRRRSGPTAALFALALFSSASILSSALDARPYSLVLGFTSLTLLCYQQATASPRRLLPLLGISAGVAAVIASHHYGVFHVCLPLLAGEAVRLYQRRRFDWPLYLAASSGLLVLFFTFPFIRSAQSSLLALVRQSPNFWASPKLADLASYQLMFPLLALPLFATALLLLAPWRRRLSPSAPPAPLPAHEVAAALALALLVPVMLTVSALVTNYFVPRYGIGSALGLAILAGLFLPRLPFPHRSAAALLSATLLLAPATVQPALQAAHLLRVALLGPGRPLPQPRQLLAEAPAAEPIVVASALAFLQQYHYAAADLRPRLVYLADPAFAYRQPDFLPEYGLAVGARYLPAHPTPFQPFLDTHPSFLLYTEDLPRVEWTARRLRALGYRFAPVAQDGPRQLVRVTRPASD